MTDSTRSNRILWLWVAGTVLFGAGVLYDLFLGEVELYAVAVLVFFLAMTIRTLSRRRDADPEKPADES